MKADIDALLDLKPNWDSYGALRANYQSCQYAEHFRTAMNSFGVDIGTASLAPNGNVCFELDNGKCSLMFEVLPDGDVTCCGLDELGQQGVYENFPLIDTEGQE